MPKMKPSRIFSTLFKRALKMLQISKKGIFCPATVLVSIDAKKVGNSNRKSGSKDHFGGDDLMKNFEEVQIIW